MLFAIIPPLGDQAPRPSPGSAPGSRGAHTGNDLAAHKVSRELQERNFCGIQLRNAHLRTEIIHQCALCSLVLRFIPSHETVVQIACRHLRESARLSSNTRRSRTCRRSSHLPEAPISSAAHFDCRLLKFDLHKRSGFIWTQTCGRSRAR